MQEAAQATPWPRLRQRIAPGTAGGAYTARPSTLGPFSKVPPSHSTLDTRHSSRPVTRSRVTAVTVSPLPHRTDGKGVLISWKTGHEVNNLGFHVWREEAGQRIR